MYSVLVVNKTQLYLGQHMPTLSMIKEMPMFMQHYRRKKLVYVDIAVIQIAGPIVLKREQSRMSVIE